MRFTTKSGTSFTADEKDKKLIDSLNLRIDRSGYISHYVNASKKMNRVRVDKKLHRLILGINDRTVFVDHINGDILDNRRCNLRLCNNSQNTKNRKKHKNGNLRYKGITEEKRYGGYVAKISVNYKRLYLGRYETQEEAALAYNRAAIKHHGEFARINDLNITQEVGY